MFTADPTRRNAQRRAWLVTSLSAAVLLLFLLAGADRPPPPGFLLLPALIIALTWVGAKWVVPTWWERAHGIGVARTLAAAAAQGAFAGAIVAGLLVLLIPRSPGVEQGLAQMLAFIVIVAIAGAIYLPMVCAFALLVRPKPTRDENWGMSSIRSESNGFGGSDRHST